MHRIAAVFGARQGSGYLLTPRLVLTAGHLIREGCNDQLAMTKMPMKRAM